MLAVNNSITNVAELVDETQLAKTGVSLYDKALQVVELCLYIHRNECSLLLSLIIITRTHCNVSMKHHWFESLLSLETVIWMEKSRLACSCYYYDRVRNTYRIFIYS